MKNLSKIALALLVAFGAVACKSTSNNNVPTKPDKTLGQDKDGKGSKDDKGGKEEKSGNEKGNDGCSGSACVNKDNKGQKDPNKDQKEPTAEEKKALEEVKKLAPNEQPIQLDASLAREKKVGEKITGLDQAYSSYVAIRGEKQTELYTSIKEGMATPVSYKDTLAKLDATYKGILTGTSNDPTEKDFLFEATKMEATFHVKDNHISGTAVNVGDAEDATVTFNKAPIEVKGDKLGFAGDANSHFDNKDHKATYQGAFAGPEANEIIGTLKGEGFEGAFGAKKQ